MPPSPSADDPANRWAPFACRWRLQGWEAASVRVSGEVDMATAHRLADTLRGALAYARLLLVDLHELAFMDTAGLHVLLDASARARTQGGRCVLAGAPAQFGALIDVTGTRAHLDLLETPPREPGTSEQIRRNGRTPFANAVNDRVLAARVMAVSDDELWLQAADGSIHRPWAPADDGLPLPAGSAVELYLDATGAVNGWYDPETGLAINQRGLAPGESPATHADLACQGPCGLVWLAPAAARLSERRERCLTCAGSLARR